MNNQEIFNKVYNGLQDQLFSRATNQSGSCLYRAPENRRCAFGHLLPDEIYDPVIEGINVPNLASNIAYGRFKGAAMNVTTISERNRLLRKAEVFRKIKDWIDANFSNEQITLISSLQRAHDTATIPSVMKQKLAEIAKIYNLSIPG